MTQFSKKGGVKFFPQIVKTRGFGSPLDPPLGKKKYHANSSICIGPTIRIGRESWCLPYAGFFKKPLKKLKEFDHFKVFFRVAGTGKPCT